MVLRDCNGQFLRGRVMRFPGKVSVFEAEVVGLFEALSWIPAGNHNVLVESDSLLVVEAVKQRRVYQFEVGTILEASHQLLMEKSNVRIGHIRKLTNKVAHLMARLSCELNSYNDFDSPPCSVLETLLYDSRLI